MSKRRRKPRPAGPPATASRRLHLRVAPENLALLRFLLEGYDNLGYLTILDRHTALARLVYSPHQEAEVLGFLASIAPLVPHVLPFSPQSRA